MTQPAEAVPEFASAGPDSPLPPPRSVALDLVRVLGVGAIIAGHTWDQRHFAQAGLYTWPVPLFFVTTGYLWRPGRTTWDEVRRRGRTLLVPYIAWLVIVSLIWFGFRAARGEPFDTDLLHRLAHGGNAIGRPYSAFWFITCLFVTAVLMRGLSNVSRYLPWGAAAVGIAWCIARPEAVAGIPESAGLALPALALLLAGQALRTVRPRIPSALLVGLALAVPAWWLGWTDTLEPLNMKVGNLGTPVLSMLMATAISCGLILLAESVAEVPPTWVKRCILAVAACAIPMILTHTLSLAITERLGYPSSKWTFLVAYFVTLFLALAIRMTPARKVLM